MTQLAIKGHATRGKEVIQLLEMLGGVNVFELEGAETQGFYYIFKDNNKIYYCWNTNAENVIVYTIEEFEEKFPYKVGDEAVLSDSLCTVKKVRWDDINDEVLYMVQGKNFVVNCDVNSLQPYKEEPIECSDKRHKGNCTIGYIQELGSRDMELIIPYNQEIVFENGRYILRDKKPKYPKTYVDCCDVLGYKNRNNTIQDFFNSCDLYDFELMTRLSMLKLCRDAYWKIAGEEMGLGKPWEPDWCNENKLKYCIECSFGTIDKTRSIVNGCFLAFPTEEMRDTFYENFKEWVEQCKEFL